MLNEEKTNTITSENELEITRVEKAIEEKEEILHKLMDSMKVRIIY